MSEGQIILLGGTFPMNNASVKTRQRGKHSTLGVIVLILLFLCFPPGLTFLQPGTSMGPGTVAVCLVALAIAAIRLRLHVRRKLLRPGSMVFVLPAMACLVSVHFLIASRLLPVDTGRFIGSLIVFILLVITARVIIPAIFGVESGKAVRIVFYAMVACAALAAANITLPGLPYFYKPVFPFTEPSHFALAFLPLLMWACVTSSGWMRHLCLLAGIAIAGLLQNLTLIVGIILVAIVYAPLLRASLIIGVIAGAALVASPDLTYYSDRLQFSTDTDNLSVLVYLQGWQMAEESIRNSSGWGVGFQQSGVNGSDSEATRVINAVTQGEDSNLLDGGFLMVKLLSDFGVFAIIATAFYVRLLTRSFQRLRAVALGKVQFDDGTVFAHAVVAMYSVEAFVRSNGYLVGTFVLFIGAVMHLHRVERSQRHASTAGARGGRSLAAASIDAGSSPAFGVGSLPRTN